MVYMNGTSVTTTQIALNRHKDVPRLLAKNLLW